ncbi:MAG: efflux RND transporter periplasmic adaptor subunit [Planctomycetota bacterium]|jgi:RND family efflux transporter MFP subunit
MRKKLKTQYSKLALMTHKNRKKFLICSMLSLFALSLFSGCKKAPPQQPADPQVTVAYPLQQNVRRYYDFTGNTRAIESVDIQARVEGFLEKAHVVDSADVKAGDLLFTIEQEPFIANVEQAQAMLESNKAELQRAEADLKRVEIAVETRAVSEQEVDLKKAQRNVAAASVKQAEAALEQTKLLLSYTKVISPIDGRISRRYVDIGNLVGSGGDKTLLTSVVKLDPMYVYFNISESLLVQVLRERGETDRQKRKTGQKRQTDIKLYISFAGENDYQYEGIIDYIDNKVDPSTGTVEMRGVLPNENLLFYPGMFVNIRIPETTETPSLLVDEKAISTDLGGKFLLIVDDQNIVERRYVKLSQLYEQMRVIEEGIQPQERYVVNGIQRARPGLPVTPKEAVPENTKETQKQDSQSEENQPPN